MGDGAAKLAVIEAEVLLAAKYMATMESAAVGGPEFLSALQKTIASVNVALGAARGDAGAPKLAAIEAEVLRAGKYLAAMESAAVGGPEFLSALQNTIASVNVALG